MSNKIYPIGIQNFEKIRNDGYFYIDKTALIYQMVKQVDIIFLAVRAVLVRACYFLLSNLIFQERKNFSKGWQWESWRKIG